MRRIIPLTAEPEQPPELFTPAFCPNPHCREHYRDRPTLSPTAGTGSSPVRPEERAPREAEDAASPAAHSAARRWFYRHGSYETAAFGTVPRYRCRSCRRGFSRQSFRLDYYAKRVLCYRSVLQQVVSCSSTRDLTRREGCTTGSVANRIERLARQAAAVHADTLAQLSLSEAVVIDGFENFAVSKYFPNNITLLAGAGSEFLYGCDYRTIRRSGRMSEQQKERRDELEERFRADRAGLRRAFAALVDGALRIACDGKPLLLRTDCHKEYRRAIARDAHFSALCETGRLLHELTHSREPRTGANPLFAANYLDRQLRKDLKECVRRTVCFGRNVANVMQRMLIYRMYHNHYKGWRHRQPRPTHGSVAGLDERWVQRRLSGVFEWREFLSRSAPGPEDLQVWLRRLPTPLKRGAEYLPKFALA